MIENIRERVDIIINVLIKNGMIYDNYKLTIQGMIWCVANIPIREAKYWFCVGNKDDDTIWTYIAPGHCSFVKISDLTYSHLEGFCKLFGVLNEVPSYVYTKHNEADIEFFNMIDDALPLI